ncbi:MAG: hypothetical protein ACTSU5_22300 [Promethearchaeota archaeon]
MKSRVSAYKRLEGNSIYEYIFELDYDARFEGIGLGSPAVANLDGPNGNNVGIVLAVGAGAPPDLWDRPTGLATLEYTGMAWILAWTHAEECEIVYKYFGSYSNLVVHDFNGDGYDDVAVKMDEECKNYERLKGSFVIGDLVVFYNVAPEGFAYDAHFCLNWSYMDMLWRKTTSRGGSSYGTPTAMGKTIW